MRDLRGATVVITGASSGIGRATALAFARRGANVAVAARRRDVLNEVAAECSAFGGRALAVETDVTQAGQVRQLATEAAKVFGGIDVWINNAGVGVVGRFESAPLAEQTKVVEVNLLGAIHGAYAALPHFLARGGRGVIINLASIGSYFPTPFAATYGASKFGLMGFTDSLRFELASRSEIQVCGVYPTFVDTPAHHHAGNYTGRSLERANPTLDPEDVAERVVSLALRPRRALNIGAPVGSRVAGALLPDVAGRWIGRLAKRKLLEEGPRVSPTDGSIIRTVPQGTGVRGDYVGSGREESGKGPLILAAVAAVAVATGLTLAGRGRLSEKI